MPTVLAAWRGLFRLNISDDGDAHDGADVAVVADVQDGVDDGADESAIPTTAALRRTSRHVSDGPFQTRAPQQTVGLFDQLIGAGRCERRDRDRADKSITSKDLAADIAVGIDCSPRKLDPVLPPLA